MKATYLVSVDIGTSSTKTGLWTEDGTLVMEAVQEYSLQRPQPAWAEIEAEQWWQAVTTTIRQVLVRSEIEPGQVAAVGLGGLGWVLLAVDRQGEPLRPAMIWLDRRAEPEAAWLRNLPEANQLVDLVANPLDASYITPKLLWLKQHEPDIFAAAHKFLTSTGFIVHRLTGEFSCDYTQAYGYHFFDIRRERWDEAAAELIGVSLDKMPPLYQSCQVVGHVTTAAAQVTGLKAGTPVIAGAVDVAVGTLGAGVVQLGQTVDQGGQAGGMAMVVDRVIVEPRLIFSHHTLPGHYLFQSGTVGGGSLAWFQSTLGQAEANAAEILSRSPFSLISTQVQNTPPGAHGLTWPASALHSGTARCVESSLDCLTKLRVLISCGQLWKAAPMLSTTICAWLKRPVLRLRNGLVLAAGRVAMCGARLRPMSPIDPLS
jgi:xylulokinase